MEQVTNILSLTESAIAEVKGMMATHQDRDMVLRIGVTAGGCSGMTYQLAFDKEIANDHAFDIDGIRVVIDPRSAEVLTGMTIDFSRSLVGGGFKFINPNAKRSCGCGESFSA
jgi:iron-sulfur cluster assembly protein